MRMLRLFRILSLIGSIVLVFACNTLNNRIQTNTLTCGDDYQGGDDFFIVEDPNGTKLSRDELEVIPLEEKNEKLRVSSRGCVEKPEIGKFIVRSKTNDWAKSIDFRISKGIQVLSLIDHGNSEVGIRCEDSTPVAVGRNELLGSFLFNRVESEFLQGFSIDYRILDPFMTIVGSGSVTLERAKVETPFADLPVGQNFSLFIKITNRLRGNSFGENRCLIFIDSTPPDIEIAVNGSIDFQKAAIWNIADVGLVEIGSRLSFLAKESDVKEIHYCATRLSDLTGKIESPNSSATCTRDNSNSTTDKTPIMSDVSSGIWRVDFFAVDAIGNRSTLRSRNFHFTSSNRTELIQSISYGEVSRAILEGQTIEAANYALRGSSMYRQLETKIEKFRVERNVTLGLTNVLNLTTLTLPLKGHREPISSMTISADGRNAFSVSLDKTVKTWDLSSGKLLRDFRLPVGDTVPSLTVDRGNQKVSVGYSYKGVEIYKSDNFSLEWDKFLEGEGSKFTVIDPSGTYLVTGDSAGVVRTRDLKNLSVMAEFGNLNSAVQNIIFSPDGNRIFVQTAASLVDEWDFVAGKRIAEYSKDKAATTLIGLSRSGKTLVLAKKDGPSEVWSTETKELLRSGDWTEIKSVLMADDDSTFLALDSQGNVDFHFLRQNGKPQKARYFSDSQQSHRMLMSADSSQILNAHYQADNLSVSFLTQDPVSLADKCKIEVGSELSFNRVEFSQNGEELEIPRDGGFEGCDLSRSKLNQILKLNKLKPYSMESLSSDRSQVLFMDADQVGLWNRLTQKEIFKVPVCAQGVSLQGVRFVGETDRVLFVCPDRWGVLDRTNGKIVSQHSQEIRYQSFLIAENGLTFYRGGRDGKIFIVDVVSGDERATLEGHVDDVFGMSLSENQEMLASTSRDRSVKLWDLKTNKLIRSYGGYKDYTLAVTFALNDSLLVSGGKDSSVRVWDVKSDSQLLNLLAGRVSWVSRLIYSKEGRRIAVFDESNVHIVDLDIERMTRKLCQVAKGTLFDDYCFRH